MTRDELLADAQTRKAAGEAKNQDLQRQAVEINRQGVELERELLGIEGEIKALTALGDSVG